ncbi:DNA-binding protein [Salipiger bermudensis]|uniref:DNA-binding protein n=1 Tax=Salipiger bermudensis TaxID=344736 RepID=UPI001CD4414C|nr:DNA-binding protein [Salipiger bermudensis]MCA0963248.1 DNA-binding protein [Salipiger bermudensis]
MPTTLDFAPRLMPVTQAAHYIGVSPSKLRCLPIPRKILDGKRVYDRFDLDSYADGLVTEGEVEPDNGGW